MRRVKHGMKIEQKISIRKCASKFHLKYNRLSRRRCTAVFSVYFYKLRCRCTYYLLEGVGVESRLRGGRRRYWKWSRDCKIGLGCGCMGMGRILVIASEGHVNR